MAELTRDHNAIKRLQSIIWPAIAGNVLWAFVSLMVKQKVETNPFKLDTCLQLATLFLLGLYLMAQWTRTDALKNTDELRQGYSIFDYLLAASIVAFAIMTETNHPWAIYALAAIYFICAAAHALEAWTVNSKTNMGLNCKYLFMPIVHIGGFALLVIGCLKGWANWSMPISVALVTGAWAIRSYFPKTPEICREG